MVKKRIAHKKKVAKKIIRKKIIRKKITPQQKLINKINNLIISDKKITWINGTNPILTVALPVYNSPKILYLALESLKNQININFNWELIIIEEYGLNYNLIKEYIDKLPNCVKIVYVPIKNKILLVEKWKYMGLISSPTSKIYVKQAADCYSPPKRLYIHNQHFTNKRCLYSTQPRGIFYNILNNRKIIYDGLIIDKKLKKRSCHLNMALKTDIIRKLPIKNITRGIDNYILNYVIKLYKLRNNNFIFYDTSIDTNNWKYSIDTDGFNNISLNRKKFYTNPPYYMLSYYKRTRYGYNNMENYIPLYIINFLQNLKK